MDADGGGLQGAVLEGTSQSVVVGYGWTADGRGCVHWDGVEWGAMSGARRADRQTWVLLRAQRS